MSEPRLPNGWDEERVQRVLEYYESQTDEEAAAEHEAAYRSKKHALMAVPIELVSAVRELIARLRAG